MLRQEQSEGLLAFIEDKIAKIKKEIEQEEASWAKAPNKSEHLEMKWCDAMQELMWKLERWVEMLEDAMDIEIVDEAPAASPSRMAKTISAVGVIGVSMALALLIAVPFLFENSELAWK
jgi:hypothetical protein